MNRFHTITALTLAASIVLLIVVLMLHDVENSTAACEDKGGTMVRVLGKAPYVCAKLEIL